MKIAISGASGKTGFRIAEEALAANYQVRLLIRKGSQLPVGLKTAERSIISLSEKNSIDEALTDCESLIIATGAKPGVDLTGPARVDACGVQKQIESCERVGVKRVILVSSLCAGKWIHPLNLFGLILLWKRIGEQSLETSSLDWTVIRPGGLNEREDDLTNEFIYFTGPNIQQDAYIPRRLLAKCCIEAINTPTSIGKIIEITSSIKAKQISMKDAIESLKVKAL